MSLDVAHRPDESGLVYALFTLMDQWDIWAAGRLDYVERVQRHLQDVRQRGAVSRRPDFHRKGDQVRLHRARGLDDILIRSALTG